MQRGMVKGRQTTDQNLTRLSSLLDSTSAELVGESSLGGRSSLAVLPSLLDSDFARIETKILTREKLSKRYELMTKGFLIKSYQIQYSILDLSGIIAIIIGFVKIYGLPEKQSKQNHTLDVCLLRFGLFFNFLFFLFTSALTIFPRLHCTGGGNGPETAAANNLHLLNGVLSVVYCSLNVLFIELLLHKTIDEGDTKKPGRQVKNPIIAMLDTSPLRWSPSSSCST